VCSLGLLWRFEAQDARSAVRANAEYRATLRNHAGWPLDEHAGGVVFAELVSNVVRHAPGHIQIDLECDGTDVILSVADDGPGFDFTAPAAPGALSEGGRGLFLVSQYATALHVARRNEGGSKVRATLRSLPTPA
jgi:anti-sigma regulatory factor (Ser/Thr protein kinase)